MEKLKVFDYLEGSGNYWNQHGFKLVRQLEDADILCLNGGQDIGSEIYNEKPIPWGSGYGPPRYKSRRDMMEIEQYEKAKRLGKFIFGICRGAQLATCLEGGSLWQHVTKHHTDHEIRDLLTGNIYHATSVHHQMMRPPVGVPYQIIATADKADYKVSQHDEWSSADGPPSPDPEIIWYPEARALCVQGHPEYATRSAFADYCTKLIEHLWADPVWPPQTTVAV